MCNALITVALLEKAISDEDLKKKYPKRGGFLGLLGGNNNRNIKNNTSITDHNLIQQSLEHQEEINENNPI